MIVLTKLGFRKQRRKENSSEVVLRIASNTSEGALTAMKTVASGLLSRRRNRGKEKVNIELGLVSIAHNMIKILQTKINEELIEKLAVAN